ncbi:MAG: serine--tRNA ligase [Desulfobacteraceae bacterium 4572_35.1]|nr:MAG: serine--tRNA ligase [Desulfobacteraceae bacterium 4572_35.1]
MLDIKFLRDNLELAQQQLATRGSAINLADFQQLDQRRRELLGKADTLKAEKNRVSALIGKTKDKSLVKDEIGRMKEVSTQIKDLDEQLRTTNEKLQNILLTIPNLPHENCPVGLSEDDNVKVRTWGSIREYSYTPRAHWDIGEELDILDFERGGKLTGARFTLYKGAGARLERALINFMLDLHTEQHKYVEMLPPFMVNRDSMTGTGQLPKFEDDLFHVEGPDYFLIPTAEVPVTNIHRDEILAAEQLPLCYTAYTPCFRKEAGSHGRDTRGLIRQHQFNKVELVKFVVPEESDHELDNLLANAEHVLQLLELPYQVVDLCTADIGFSATRTFDIEVWLPGQNVYREISSCSNFRDFQARRAAIRYRPEEGAKTEYVHTINGSGLAVGRTLLAILENYQQEDGSVVVPKVLQPYMGGLERITGK